MIEGKIRPYKVSEITELIKSQLEERFPAVAIEGEISNFRPASSGHLYFTLKDRDAMISVVMFRSRATALPFTPEDGMLVLALGSISVYPKRGNYQLICEEMQLAGVGEILVMLEERKRRLAAEGLFDESRKKPLPLLPSRVAVVTSATGAAIRDILNVLKRRNSGLNLVVLPAAVQGDAAAPAIARQIRNADRFHLGDVIIVGRGGGALEDLLPFSDEQVVRAIAECSLPVISAVGHEVDFALSDFAADLRAPTPSAAAEIVTASRDELRARVLDLGHGIARTFLSEMSRFRVLLRQFKPENLERNFRILVQPMLVRLDDATESLLERLRLRVTESRHRLALALQTVESCSPFDVLKRGYAIVYRDSRVITRAELAERGKGVRVRFHAGELDASVTEIRKGAISEKI